MNTKLFLIIISIVCTMIWGCASKNEVYSATQQDLYKTVDQIYTDILNRNVQAVYEQFVFPPEEEMSLKEFEDYFNENYPFILEEFTQYRDAIQTHPFRIWAHLPSDPCGDSGLTMDSSGQWRFTDKLRWDLINLEEYKYYQISILNSREFQKVLKNYIESHPEVSSFSNKIYNSLPNVGPNQIQVNDTDVVIQLTQAHHILLRCYLGQGWTLAEIQ